MITRFPPITTKSTTTQNTTEGVPYKHVESDETACYPL